MKHRPVAWSALLASGLLLLAPGRAAGAGYAILEQSVVRMGTAYAGGAAAADDASTVFYNPAGLTRLPGSQAVAGLHLIFPSARFRDHGSTHLTGLPLTGGNGGNAGGTLAVPNAYFSQQVSERVHLGMGAFSPFGLSTQYNPDWVGRYHAVKSDLISLNLNPAVACAVTRKLSLGAGVSAQYLKSELSNAIDFGTIFGSLGAPGFAPQRDDGLVTFKADSWSWGYNLGGLYQFDDETRVGVAYRSAVHHTLRGYAHFSGVPSVNPTGRFQDTGVKAKVTTPDTLSVSLWHSFTDEIAAMGDVTWTNWSKLQELRIRFDNPNESDAVTTFRWEDSFRYSLGALYAPGAWSFRAGVAYDESPVPDAARGNPRVPDEDRVWIAAGLGYKMRNSASLNLGYAHLFVKDAQISKSTVGEERIRGGVVGSYQSNVDLVSAELDFRF